MVAGSLNRIVLIALLACGICSAPGSEQRVLAQQAVWAAPPWVMNANQLTTFRQREYLNARKALSALNPTTQQVTDIKRIVHFYLSQLLQNDPANLPKTVGERLLNNEVNFASAKAREIIMDEILARAPELMTYPDGIVRYNVVALAVQLNAKPAPPSGEAPAVPYNPTHKFLITVLTDASQQLDCRILAARGLIRICRDGENAPSSNEKSDIATSLVQALAATPPSKDDGQRWFRYRLIEALGYVDRVDNTATQPIVVDALLEVIMNRGEVWLNRSQAALSISQLPYPASVNVPLITDGIMKLLSEMTAAYNKVPTAPDWRESFVRIYFSFRPRMARQAKEKKWGLLYQVERNGLGPHAAYVKGAWAVAFPILKPFVEGANQAPPAAAVTALTAWLQNNQPANRQAMPGGKEFPAAATAKPDTPAATGLVNGPEE